MRDKDIRILYSSSSCIVLEALIGWCWVVGSIAFCVLYCGLLSECKKGEKLQELVCRERERESAVKVSTRYRM